MSCILILASYEKHLSRIFHNIYVFYIHYLYLLVQFDVITVEIIKFENQILNLKIWIFEAKSLYN